MLRQYLSIIGLLLLASCLGPRGELPEYSRELARVGDVIIKEDAVRLRLRLDMNIFPADFFKDYHGGPVKDHAELGPMFTKVLHKLIDDAVILEYGRAQSIAIPEEELQQRFEKRKKVWQPDALEEFLEKSEVPYSRFKTTIEEEARVQYVLETALFAQVKVTAAEISAYYTKHAADYKVEEQVRIRQMVTDTPEKAALLLERLKTGENFAKLAINHSLSPDRAKGGDVGFFSRGTYPKEFDEVCFKLTKGQISGVVKSDYGYHIFKLLDKRPAHVMSLLEVTPQIQQKIFEDKLLKAYPAWMEKAKKDIAITVHTDVVESFSL